MSRTIDVSDPGTLPEADRRYLAERARLPKGAEPVDLSPNFTPLAEQVNTGTANTDALTVAELEALLEQRRAREEKEAESNLETDRQELKRQKAGVAPSVEEDEPVSDVEQYKKEDGWTDDRLKQELERRGLEVEGDRKTLRARLVRDDRSSSA